MGAYKTVVQTTTIEAALNDAASELVSLRDELTEWRDNMEEKLSHTEKFEAVSAAADTLDEADGLDDKAGEIIDNLELLAEGRAEVIGCPIAHVVGTPCAVCGWNGEGQPNPKAKVDVYTTARPLGSDIGLSIVGKAPPSIYFCFPNGKPRERERAGAFVRLFENEAEARQALGKVKLELAVKYRPVPAPMRTAVTPLAPLPGAKGLANTAITVPQSEPTRKGRGTSRATRLGNATMLAKGAIEALRLKLEDLKDGTKLVEEHTNIIESIEEELEEYEQIVDNCESVDFPGMF